MSTQLLTHPSSTPDVGESSSPGKNKACLVCSSPTGASPHFGTISCLACAAFFRRTVSLNIKFKCSGSHQCRIYYELRMICRSCRFDKCISVGMKPECVQKRKPVLKQSIKRSFSPMEHDNIQPELPNSDIHVDGYESSIPSSSNSEFMSNPNVSPHLSINSPIEYKVNDMITPTPVHPMQHIVPRTLLPLDSSALLRHFVNEEQKANNRRRVMFARSPTDSIIGTSNIMPYTKEDLIPYTVKGQQTHMRFDQMLAYEYIQALPGFELLEPHDKLAIFRFCFMGFCALDIAFFTSKLEMVEKGIMVFTDASYSTNFDRAVGWDNEDDITAEEKQKLVWPMNQKFWERLIKPLDGIAVDHVEYAALKALSMWRTYNLGYLELSDTAKQLAREHENGIINGLMEYYQTRGDGAERVGTIILFIGNLFEIYQTLVEYYKKIELFNLIKIDMFLRELLQF